MKFTEEEVFEKIKNALSNNGKKTLNITDRSIKGNIKKMIALLANDETELDSFVESIKPFFDEFEGNLRSDNSKFIKKWEDEHKQQSSEEESASKTDQTEATVNPEIQKLLDRITLLENEQKENKTKAALREKKSSIEKKLGDKGVKDAEWIDTILSEVNITEEMDVDASVEKYVKLYNRTNAQTPIGVSPLGASAGSNENNPLAGASAYMKQQREAQEKVFNNK